MKHWGDMVMAVVVCESMVSQRRKRKIGKNSWDENTRKIHQALFATFFVQMYELFVLMSAYVVSAFLGSQHQVPNIFFDWSIN